MVAVRLLRAVMAVQAVARVVQALHDLVAQELLVKVMTAVLT